MHVGSGQLISLDFIDFMLRITRTQHLTLNADKMRIHLRLPILSPPGLGIRALPNLAVKGPIIITEPRKDALLA